jgi:hypothetical protein
MKKYIFIALLLPMLIIAASLAGRFVQVAHADPSGGGPVVEARAHVGGGGGHGGGGYVGRGGHGGGGFRHGGGHFGLWFGPLWGPWDPFFYPYYPYYPYYAPPTVVVPQQPEEYILPAPQPQETGYWYYCRDARGYYPQVKRCPSGWMKVVPSPSPPDQD